MIRRFAIWLLRDELRARRAAAHNFARSEWRASGQANKRARSWWDGYGRALEALEKGPGL